MICCDLCGADNPHRVLESARLDGPLVKCRACGFRYVGTRRSALTFGSDAAGEVVNRVRLANKGLRHLRLEEEHRLADLNARRRVDLIRRFRPSGKLLEVGCARGDFLRVARQYFTASGVEPNPELAEDAARVAPVYQGIIETEPGRDYDVAASFHVIEHVDSPRRFLSAIADRLSRNGLLVIETPDIDSLPFRVLKSRWRQFIPEHYYFFDRRTMTKLLESTGFKVERISRIGKYASAALVLNRLSRYCRPLRHAEDLATTLGIGKITVEIDPLDIMIAVATRERA